MQLCTVELLAVIAIDDTTVANAISAPMPRSAVRAGRRPTSVRSFPMKTPIRPMPGVTLACPGEDAMGRGHLFVGFADGSRRGYDGAGAIVAARNTET